MTADAIDHLTTPPSMETGHRHHVLRRLRQALAEGDLDAIVAIGPENCYYVSGFPSLFAYQPITKSIAAIAYRDESLEPTLVLTELEERAANGIYGIDCRTIPIWMGIEDPFNLRPGDKQMELVNEISSEAVLVQVVQALKERGVDLSRVAVEVGELDHAGYVFLADALGQNSLADATTVLGEARRIKSWWEIDQLRSAVEITERAIVTTCERIADGTTMREISRTFHESVYVHGGEGVRLAMITLGEQFGPSAFGSSASLTARQGEIIKFDVGAMVNGYGADMARTFSLGPAPADTCARYDALRVGYDYIIETAGPGVRLADLFDGSLKRIRASGLPDYARGHVGHSLGMAREVEEWPYVATGVSDVLEPGMVMCFETPYYAWGVGGLQCEDVIVVTESGIESLSRLSRELVELPS